MKVIRLQAQNFKRLSAIDITPEGNTVIISGRNAAGKSSVLDAIWAALSGKFANGLDKAVKDGEKKASVKLETETLIITRNWTETGKPTLKVENKEGAKFSSPQAILDDLVGSLSFDPLAFTRQSGKAQLETLLSLVDLGINLEEVDAEAKKIFDQRTEIGREGKQLAGALQGCPTVPEDTPDEPVSVAVLMEEMDKANSTVASNIEERHLLKFNQGNLSDTISEIASLEEQLEEARARRESLLSAIADMQPKVAALIDPDIDSLRSRISQADTVNANVRAKQQSTDLAAKVRAKRAEYDELTGQLNAVQQRKAEALQQAIFPVDGLGFAEDGVTFQGIPFSQASSAEQLRVSLGMAMALNPILRVIRITDGSLLDSDSMAEVQRMATENDYQVWVETVDTSGKLGIVIEDGEVA
jgi:DNA repair exonuclease SbcCD ATPase subunit